MLGKVALVIALSLFGAPLPLWMVETAPSIRPSKFHHQPVALVYQPVAFAGCTERYET